MPDHEAHFRGDESRAYIPYLDGFVRVVLAIGPVGLGLVSHRLVARLAIQAGWHDG